MVLGFLAWGHRVLRRDGQLLERVQWLFVLLNCLLAVLVFLDLTYPDAPTGSSAAVMLAAFVALGVWSLAYFRTGGRSLALDAVPLLLLLVGGVAAGSAEWIFARMYVVVFLSSLYRPGRGRLIGLTGLYLVMYQAVQVLSGEPLLIASVISEGVSLLVVVGIMQTLAAAVMRHERFAARDAMLTEVIADLLRERDPERINSIVTDALYRLVDIPGAMVSLWRGDGESMHRVGLPGTGLAPLLQADLRGVPAEFHEIYTSGRPAYLTAEQFDRLHTLYGLPVGSMSNAVLAPVLRDGVPVGLLVVGSPEPLDDDLLRVFERFAHEVSLAQQLAERDAMLAGLVENSSDVIAVVTEQGTLSFVSAAIQALTGVQAKTLHGHHIGELLAHSLDGQTVAGPDEFPARTPTPFILRSGDACHDVEVSANPLPDGTTILNIRDVSERLRLEAEIEYRAFYDSVTGLPNRALLLDRIRQALRRCERDGGVVAVALLDVDDFKAVNDGLGHSAGDELLVQIARRLGETLRDVDTAARLGGDEFALVLEGFESGAQADVVIDRVLDVLRKPVVVEGRELTISASVGVTTASTSSVPEELIRNADTAMYAAKKAGKNRRATFEPSMHQEGASRLELRGELEAALRNEQFVLHYQPIMDLENGGVTGFEALVRWDHPARGLVPPGDFIGLAEETGLIVALGDWVLREACDQVARWQTTSHEPLNLAVNLSAVQLRSPAIIGHVAAALADAGLPPHQLTLEVTETSLLRDTAAVREVLIALKRIGVRLAIDDFGTGYSSFAHLQWLPIDVIKVDRSFVSVVGDGPQHAAFARAIVNVAHTLGLETVAEGVEVGEHSDLLRSWGCSRAQGWLWHPALPADQAALLLGRGAVATAVRS